MKDSLKSVGIWGQWHYQYLKENKPSVIGVMRLNGNLIPYLQSVDEQADEMAFQLVKQIAKQEGVTEELKRRDQMAWIGAMNNIRDRVNEIGINEVICVWEKAEPQLRFLLQNNKIVWKKSWLFADYLLHYYHQSTLIICKKKVTAWWQKQKLQKRW